MISIPKFTFGASRFEMGRFALRLRFRSSFLENARPEAAGMSKKLFSEPLGHRNRRSRGHWDLEITILGATGPSKSQFESSFEALFESIQLESTSFRPADSVHGYARVHPSYIYIYMFRKAKKTLLLQTEL